MIDIQFVEEVHNILIEQFGGTKGIRDRASLESAIYRPFATFDGEELYPAVADKVAALLESLLINHPFIDGNKRIGYVMMRLHLLENKLDLQAAEDEKYNFIIQVAEGKLGIDQIKEWIAHRIISL